MADVAQFREFVSPHDYVYEDCVIYRGVMYQCNNLAGTGGRWVEHDWDIFISSELTEEVAELSEGLSVTITALTERVNTNTQDIEYLNRLVGLLVLELLKNGIEINNEELQNELNNIV